MDDFNEIISELKNHLHEMDRTGTSFILQQVPDETMARCEKCKEDCRSSEVGKNSAVSDTDKDNFCGVVDNKKELSDFRVKVESCQRCAQLVKGRRNVVFGAGNPNADLMFIGEAPGRDEDIQGIPFIGRAGQLLTKILQSIKIKREDVFIANILKCRPPNNRNPLPDEIDNCIEYLLKQIDIIKPKVICALGAVATKTLLKTDRNISSMRGQKLEFHNVTFIPTYHPSYLLRSPYMKKTVWNDMLMVKKVLSE